MKIKLVTVNNRKRCFEVQIGRTIFEYPFSKLEIRPTPKDRIERIVVDPELNREGFTFWLRSGKEETVHVDHVLHWNREPDYICDLMLYEMTNDALQLIRRSGTTKRELARRLKTSPKQLYRLLNPTFYGKTINQMVKLLYVLGKQVSFVEVKNAA